MKKNEYRVVKAQFQQFADAIDVYMGSQRGKAKLDDRASKLFLQGKKVLVEFGPHRGSLVDAYIMIDKLRAAGLIQAGDKGFGPDLDEAMYSSLQKPLRIGRNAAIGLTSDGKIQLTFLATKSAEETKAGIAAAVESLQKDYERRRDEKRKWEENLARDRERDHAPPLFNSAEVDEAVLRGYVYARILDQFEGSHPSFARTQDYKGRPGYSFKYDHAAGTSCAANNDFIQSLTKTFDGVVAVMPHMGGSDTDTRLGFSIFGTPSRLLRDVVRNDPSIRNGFPQLNSN